MKENPRENFLQFSLILLLSYLDEQVIDHMQ